MKKNHIIIYALFALLALAHIGLLLTTPSTSLSQRFNVLDPGALGLRLTIIPLTAAAWIMACHAALTMLAAAASPKVGAQKAYRRIAAGVFVIAGASVFNSLLRDLAGRFGINGLNDILTVYGSPANILAQLVGFSLILSGSTRLENDLKNFRWSFAPWEYLACLGAAALYGVVVWVMFSVPSQVGLTGLIAVLFFASCIVGLMAVFRFASYYRSTAGSLARAAVRKFSLGVLCIVFGLLLSQAYSSVGSARLTSLGFELAFLLLIPFTGLQLTGYSYLASGARKMAAMERVMEQYETNAPKADDWGNVKPLG